MKRILILILSLFSQFAFAQTEAPFFNVVASGTPGHVSMILCLDAIAPMSCQHYEADALSLSITTTIPNHVYPNAGIKVESKGYSFQGCRAHEASGYCLFQASQNTPVGIELVSSSLATIYAGTSSGYIRVSNDGGHTWSQLTQPGGSFGYGLFVLDADTYYMGGANGTVQVSTDGGTTWAPMQSYPDGSLVSSIFALDANNIYVSTFGEGGSFSGNVYLTTDGGESWNALPALPNSPSAVGQIYVRSGTIYASNASGVYTSPVINPTWTAFTPPPGTTSIQTYFIADPTHYYFTINNETNLMISSDGGSTWASSSSYPLPGGTGSALFVDGFTNIYSGTEENALFNSSNGGSSWQGLSTPPYGGYLTGLFYEGSDLYASTINGQLGITSNDGTNWRLATQPGGNLNYGFYIAPNGTMYVGGSNGSVQSSTDGGQTWTPLPAYPDFEQIWGITQTGNTLYVATSDDAVLYSTDQGYIWHNSSSFPPGGASTVAASGNLVYTYAEYNLYVSGDGGVTYSLAPNVPDGSAINSLFLDQNVLYAGTENGGVYFSTNGATTWTAFPPFTDGGSAVNAVYVHNGIVYAGTDCGRVEVYSAATGTWTPTATLPDGFPVLSLSVQ